jgi:AraC-like DNA-binding protein
MSFGGTGTVTKLVCGGMLVENRRINPLLAILPPLLHVKRADESAQHWLGFSTRQILSELDSERTGAKEIINRLADLLFVVAVRSYFEQNTETNAPGWLAGVRDPQIGAALAMLHRRPHQNWTLASLARRLAMSRSSFAARFTELVGEPPQQYCTRLRIHAAAVRLRTTADKLSAVAAIAGYQSESSFVRAFRRHAGMTPG